MDTAIRKIITTLSLFIAILGAGPVLNAQSEGNDNYDYHTMGDKNFDFDSFAITRSEIVQNPGGNLSITKQMSAVIKEFPAGDKGLLLIFRNIPLRIDIDNNKPLFDFVVNEQGVTAMVVSAYLSDSTLEFRRYNSLNQGTSSYYPYKLYDKLFGLNMDTAPAGAALNYEIHIYIKGSFIWVELNNMAISSLPDSKSKYAHSPVYWGMNASGEFYSDVMDRYLSKNPACGIRVYSPFINEDDVPLQERIPYLRVASFNTDELHTDLNERFTKGLGSAGSGGSAKGISAPVTTVSTGYALPDFTTRQQAIKNNGKVVKPGSTFSLAPNPVTSGYITVTSTLQCAQVLDITISDSRGSKLQHLQYQLPPGVLNKRVDISPALPNGFYYITLRTVENTETKKLILIR